MKPRNGATLATLLFAPLALGACVDSGHPTCDSSDAGPSWDASLLDEGHVDPDASADGLGCSDVFLLGCGAGFTAMDITPGCVPLYADVRLADGDRVPVTRLGCDGGVPAVLLHFGPIDGADTFSCYTSGITAEVPGAAAIYTSSSVLVDRSGGAIHALGPAAATLPQLDSYEDVPVTITAMENWRTQTYHLVLDDPRF